MKIFIDDGSTNIKLQWEVEGVARQAISPNSFKREWGVAFGSEPVFNYTLNGENYSFDPISPEALITTRIDWQYSDVNVVAVHHALLKTGLEPQPVDIVVTLPLTEFYNHDNQPDQAKIARKQASLMRPVTLNGGETFTVRSVQVMPESIPAGYRVLKEMDDLDSLLIIDLGGTTLDISHVRAKMRGISRIYGSSSLGVSLMTGAVTEALSTARTKVSSWMADVFIINRHDDDFLRQRINDVSCLESVKAALSASQNRLINRVTDAVNTFSGYSHVMVIGGGAELIAGAVREHCGLRDDRFIMSESSQFDLVSGMYAIG
ncbi:plasmid segregation protein ParM [Mangrovibacter phragmitis]|uniref:plasmid segregation protein ParM n=1 Tax=Mangrovibacter phragmitis TaxID=1691903 RepID=UPI00336A0BB9